MRIKIEVPTDARPEIVNVHYLSTESIESVEVERWCSENNAERGDKVHIYFKEHYILARSNDPGIPLLLHYLEDNSYQTIEDTEPYIPF